jgi:PKD domain
MNAPPRTPVGISASAGPRARASADGLTVVLYVSPARVTAGVAVGFRVQAAIARARGALSYAFVYGDGATTSRATPQFCLGGSGAPFKATWRLRHRYEKPGRYHVAVTVRAGCTSGQVTATTVVNVVSPTAARPR